MSYSIKTKLPIDDIDKAEYSIVNNLPGNEAGKVQYVKSEDGIGIWYRYDKNKKKYVIYIHDYNKQELLKRGSGTKLISDSAGIEKYAEIVVSLITNVVQQGR